MKNENALAPMLNLYPDSMGGTLKDIATLLESDELRDTFGSIYILPSIYNTDLDRGFSVIDYNINELFATAGDLDKIKSLGLDLKLDFILNHASVLSPQFQDLLEKGQASEYKDFFINWNKFWDGCGEMTEEGYIQPDKKYLDKMFFRKPGLPIFDGAYAGRLQGSVLEYILSESVLRLRRRAGFAEAVPYAICLCGKTGRNHK